MTDPNGDEVVPPPAVPDPNQPDYKEYEFTSTVWDDPPVPSDAEWFGKEERTIREANAYAYQQYGTTYDWSRYVHLGYFAFTQCNEFNKIWANIQNDPVSVHRAIWYNFQYHVERDIPMTEPLTTWAMNMSHPFLEYHDIKYLDVDTLKYSTGVVSTYNIGNLKTPEEPEWIPVNNKKRPPNKKTTEPAKHSRGTKGILRQPNKQVGQSKRKSNGPKNKVTKNQSHIAAPTGSAKANASDSISENESEEEVMEIDENSDTSGNQSSTVSKTLPALTEPIPPHPKISTNDGTHRITVRWIAPSDVSEFEADTDRLNEALHTLMTTLFQDTDGVFYKWESEEMTETKAASSLSLANAREFVSPKVTFIGSRSTMVFGLRFGFLSSPGNWQHSDRTKKILKEQHMHVLISNSKSTSGDLVTAGYILLKAPNTTHRHHYTQYLRSKLPEATPYFDIVRFKMTPMDQAIPHLAVQCGEKHVTPVCKSLLSILTGDASALFLPRYAFQTMPQDQIKRHFDVHLHWSRSLKPIQLSKISHLDQQRVEYFDNGTILKRSTREWALSLTLPNGKSAHCDAVNGGSDRKAFLACPTSYFTQAQQEWQQYRTRLYPPSHREARYAESVSDLPDMSNISIEIKTNVSILDNLSAAAIWNQAPTSVRESGKQQGKQRAKNKQKHNRSPKAATTQTADLNDSVPNASSDAEDSLGDSDTHISGHTTNDESEVGSTASTVATSTAPPNDAQARFRELERRIQQAQKQSDVEGKATAAKLSGIQSQFNTMEARMSTLQETQQQLSEDISQMNEQSNRNFTEIRENMISSMEATSNLSQSMLEIRSQFNTMSQFMADLAQSLETALNRRGGIPPEVNLTSPNGPAHNGSESSSCLGDPSQTAKSDASKTASQVSSIGKRALYATQGSNTQHEAAPPVPRPSPIKKKHRVRTPSDPNQTDQSDDDMEENEDNLPVNLDESRFQRPSPTKNQFQGQGLTESDTVEETYDTEDEDDTASQPNLNLDDRFLEDAEYNDMEIDNDETATLRNSGETPTPAQQATPPNGNNGPYPNPTTPTPEAPPSPQYNDTTDSAGAATE
jgi:hypothetical protein